MQLTDLETPALVIDLDRVDSNVTAMAELARQSGVALRPHVKTHKMPELATRQMKAGVVGFTCATLAEAEMVVEVGCDDVLVAFPLVGAIKLRRLAALRERVRVTVSLDSVEVAEGLAALGACTPVEVLVEVDTGLGRLGRPPGAPTVALVEAVARLKGVQVVGLLTHAGHAYRVTDPDARLELVRAEVETLVATRDGCARHGIELGTISVGSTPTVRAELIMEGVTEVRPGTYIFNDTTMVDLGVATEDECGASVLATVVGRPSGDRFVIDAGTKSLTSDGVGRPGWVRVASHPELVMSFLSEEHGVGYVTRGSQGPAVGDRLRCIPSHVCPVANLFDLAYGVRGDTVVATLPVVARGH
ncbi:MAG: alanine racemase [Acidimicrobiales bacterium]